MYTDRHRLRILKLVFQSTFVEMKILMTPVILPGVMRCVRLAYLAPYLIIVLITTVTLRRWYKGIVEPHSTINGTDFSGVNNKSKAEYGNCLIN